MFRLQYPLTRWSKSWVKQTRSIVRWRWMRWLEQLNQGSTVSVVGDEGPVVSLTTFGQRWERVFYSLESIGAGRMKPSRLMLWVSSDLLRHQLPDSLKRLQRRGVEICGCEDVGPHTKYYPAVNATIHAQGLVTADDDVLYQIDWLERLNQAAAERPEVVVAHRVRTMVVQPDGALAPYVQWRHCSHDSPSHLNFALGVGGVFYPATMQEALRAAGSGFKATCPRADDVWLKAVALRGGMPVQQVTDLPPIVIDLPGARGTGLARSNVMDGGNDAQIRSTFSSADIRLLGQFEG